MNNSEYILKFIIEILMTNDLKDGASEDLLAPHLTRENTKLFLHELSSWLRSPFEELEDWDKTVQYLNEWREFEQSHLRGCRPGVPN
jgi:hypothetical protein